MASTIFDVSALELHYVMTDGLHVIDASVQNKAERALLDLMQEVFVQLGISCTIETELTREGGIKKYFSLVCTSIGKLTSDTQLQNTNFVPVIVIGFIAKLLGKPTGVFLTGVAQKLSDKIFEDKELSQLQKDLLRKQAEALDIDNKKKLQEIDNYKKITQARSQFYMALAKYLRLAAIKLTGVNNKRESVMKYDEIKREDFDDYIQYDEPLPDEYVENVPIVVISPVLNSKTTNRGWRGIYEGKQIAFRVESQDFRSEVDNGLIEFKNGFTLRCNMRIERRLCCDGYEQRTYIVTTVIGYMIDGKLCETAEWKRYKRRKAQDKAQGQLDFGD